MNTINNYDMRKHFLVILFMGLLMMVVLSSPDLFRVEAVAKNYLLFHNIIEMFSVVSASLIFALGWSAYNYSSSKSINLLSIIFLSIAIFDFSHLLSYSGMPDYITPSSPEKGINFWLAARLVASFGFFIFSIASLFPIKNYFNRYVLFSLMVILTLFTHWIFLFHPDLVPHTFIPGQGLTNFKIYTEYVIIGLNIVTLIVLYIRIRQSHSPYIPALFTAISIMAMSEFFFTLYNEVNDVHNVFGHIYKAISYLYIYKVLFVATIRQPYEELDKSQLELLNKNTLLDTIVDNIPNMIFLKDANDLRFIRLNSAGEKLLGHSKSDFIGKNDYDFFSKNEADSFTKFDRKVFYMKTGIDIPEENIETALGNRILHTKKVPIFDEDGKPKYLLGISEDITDRKATEKKLQEQEEVMIAQSRQAAMGDMIAMIAHQWRQPITVIAMEANNITMNILMEEEITTEELKKMSESITEQTQQLSKTIDDFRNFFKPNKKKVKTTVGSVLESTLKIVGKSMENNNIAVMIENRSETEIWTYSNELLQVFLNLLNNAKDILLDSEVSDAKTTIKIDETKDSIVTKICDNGGGIPKGAIKRLGEPYFTTKEHSGTGLGLYMSITIVEKHLNGSLTWENRDKGACFIVTLPKG